MRKAAAVLFLILTFIMPCSVLAVSTDIPDWDYPVPAVILYDPSDYLVLANRQHLLDSSYSPTDLVKVTAKHVNGDFELRRACHEALSAMFNAAKEAGYTLYVKSAYRSYGTQSTMYENRLDKNKGRDDGWVSYPGASDHQTGLGVDVLNYAWTQKDGMNAEFAKTAEAKWMAEHCHEYGFVIRYQSDKQAITGINFEPWHLRYVGTECAAYMKENNLSLEEFTEEWQAYVASYNANGGDFEAYCKSVLSLPDPMGLDIYDNSGDEEMSFFFPGAN